MAIPGKSRRKIYGRKLKSFWEDFRRNKIGFVGLIIIFLYVIVAVLAPYMTPYDPIRGQQVAARYALPEWVSVFSGYADLPPTIRIPLNWTSTIDYDEIDVQYNGRVVITYSYEEGLGEFRNYTFQVPFDYDYRTPPSFEIRMGWNAQFSNVTYRLEVFIHTPSNETFQLFGDDYNVATQRVEVLPASWNVASRSFLETSGSPSLRRRIDYERAYSDFYQRRYEEYIGTVGYQEYYAGRYRGELRSFNRTRGPYYGDPENWQAWINHWYGSDGYWNTTGIKLWTAYETSLPIGAADYAARTAKIDAASAADAFSPADAIFSARGTYMLTLNLIVQPLSEDASLIVNLNPEANDRFRIWGSVSGLLGTNSFGQDVFTQLVYGARISLLVGLLAAVIATSLGIIFGVVSGYLGGIVDEFTMRIVDILLCLPVLPILLALSAYFKPNVYFIVVLIAIFGWQGLSRVIRSRVLSLREMPFVESATASGASDAYLIFRHLIPNVFPIAMAAMILAVPGAILTEAALSFLGFGDPSAPTWGKMLYEAQQEGAFKSLAFNYVLPPGLAITFLCVAFVFLGHALDEIVNPRLRRRR